jgi:PAS domain S-box-containing protein
MATELRKTGISVVGYIPWGVHFCNFYETKQDMLEILIPYFKAGLESNEFCIWVVSNYELITTEEAKAVLKQAVPDLDRYLSDGNIEILNGDEWYLEDNVFSLERVTSAWDAKLKRALALGYDGMRLSGDTFWLREKIWEDFNAYEKYINDSFTHRPITLLCTYPLAKSGASDVLDVVQAHHFAIARRQGGWEVIETPQLLQAKAEIKRLNEHLQRVIKRTSRPPSILSYGVAVLSVTATLIIALWMRMEVGQSSTPIVGLFLCSVMVSAWFGGIGPGLLAIALSLLAIDYYFVTPIYSLAVDIREIPRLLIFALSALFVGLLSAAQRSKAESLTHARDVLDVTAQELKLTNEALQAENAERKRAEDALRRSEDRIRLIIDTIPTMAWSIRPDGTVDFVNQRWLEYTGEGGIEDPNHIVHPEDLPSVMEKWLVNMAAGEVSENELRLRRADGVYRWFMVRTAPLRDEQGNLVKWYGVSIDIEDHKQAEERLRATTEHLRALSARFQSAKEEEGARIAREIHDELGASLSSLRWDLEDVDEVLSESPERSQLAALRKKIEAMIRLSDTTVDTVRRIASELRPIALDEFGITEAIQWHAQQFQERTGIIVYCDCSLENLALNREQSTAVFRIFQEAMTNILRHAQATRIDITLKQEGGELVLTISDNGKGITEDDKSISQSLGLLGMRERAYLIGGKIDINGAEGKGTVVTVRVPMPG